MTELKKVGKKQAPNGADVAYLWTRSGRRKKPQVRRPGSSARREDPMFIPWGDIVEFPLRVIKRLFERS